MSLILDARQRAMLAEMGVAVWQPKGSDMAAATVAPALPEAPAATHTPTPVASPSSSASNVAAVGRDALTPLSALTAAVHAEQGLAHGAPQQGAQAQRENPEGEAAQASGQRPSPAAASPMPAPSARASAGHASETAMAAGYRSAPGESLGQQAVSDATEEKLGGRPARPQDHSPADASSFSPIAQVAQAAVAPLMRAPSGPVADMDWPALREAVHSCQACGLCQGRTQTVFGVGAERADWMVVGEAPGEQEDLRGEPFVGPAGQLLDAMLRAVGKDRQAPAGEQAVFIANVLKCRPPGNRNPAPEEVAQCEPYLRRQVELVQPRLILALGRFAVQALLNTSEPIGRLRQQVHRYQGVPVVVSYHPAYLLRNLPDKAKAWDDLVLAMRVASEGQ